MKNTILAVVVTAACVFAFTSRGNEAPAQQKRTAAERWEYAVLTTNTGKDEPRQWIFGAGDTVLAGDERAILIRLDGSNDQYPPGGKTPTLVNLVDRLGRDGWRMMDVGGEGSDVSMWFIRRIED